MVVFLFIVAGLGVPARAQRSHGYFFVAPGGTNGTATLHLGGGVEGGLGKGIGVGAELGALGPTRSFDDVLGVFSANGYYHFFRDDGRKADPFVTGGYTLFFRSGTANLGNLGGGVNYWLGERIGLKIEFRDHIRTPGRGTLHFYGIRFGITVRN